MVARLQHRGCEGSCASYQVTVLADGRVTWEGDRRGSATLGPASLSAIERAFADARFFSLDRRLLCTAGDAAPIVTFHDDGRRTRTIWHEATCDTRGRTATIRAQAAALTKLEATIERIVDAAGP